EIVLERRTHRVAEVRCEPCSVGARICHFAEQRTVDVSKPLGPPNIIRRVPVERNRDLATKKLERDIARSLEIKLVPGGHRERIRIVQSSKGASTGRGSRSNRGRRVRLSIRKGACWAKAGLIPDLDLRTKRYRDVTAE